MQPDIAMASRIGDKATCPQTEVRIFGKNGSPATGASSDNIMTTGESEIQLIQLLATKDTE